MTYEKAAKYVDKMELFNDLDEIGDLASRKIQIMYANDIPDGVDSLSVYSEATDIFYIILRPRNLEDFLCNMKSLFNLALEIGFVATGNTKSVVNSEQLLNLSDENRLNLICSHRKASIFAFKILSRSIDTILEVYYFPNKINFKIYPHEMNLYDFGTIGISLQKIIRLNTEYELGFRSIKALDNDKLKKMYMSISRTKDYKYFIDKITSINIKSIHSRNPIEGEGFSFINLAPIVDTIREYVDVEYGRQMREKRECEIEESKSRTQKNEVEAIRETIKAVKELDGLTPDLRRTVSRLLKAEFTDLVFEIENNDGNGGTIHIQKGENEQGKETLRRITDGSSNLDITI